MMPKNHFEGNYRYYDAIKNTSPLPRDLQTQFYNKEKLNKVKIYFKSLEVTHQFLYDEEFEREEYNLFPSKNIPLDWIIWYDCYNKKFRDPLYSYGYRLHTAKYLHDPNYKFEQGLIQFSRASNQVLVETEPTYLHKVYSRYTTYDYNQGKSISVPYNNILVQQN